MEERRRCWDASTPLLALLAAMALIADAVGLAVVTDSAVAAPGTRCPLLETAFVATVAAGLALGSAAVLWPTLVARRERIAAVGGERRRGWRAVPRALATASVLASLLVVSGASAFAADRVLVDRLALAAPAGARAAAVRLLALLPAIRAGTAVIDGLDVPPAVFRSADGRILAAMLPAAVLATGDGAVRDAASLRPVFRGIVEQSQGGAAAAYDDRFIPSVRALRDAFNQYVDVERTEADAVSALPARVALAWTQYLASLASHGERDGHLPRADWLANAAAVRTAGVPVPTSWRPDDHAVFAAAAAAADRRRLDQGFADRIRTRLGIGLPSGLDWPGFVAAPVVQVRWRRAIGAPDGVLLTPDMGFSAYEATVYEPRVSREVEARYGPILGPSAGFAAGAARGRLGARAMVRVVMLPALLLAGALLVLVAAAVLVAQLARIAGVRRPRRFAAAAALLLATLPGATIADPVLSSPAFLRLDGAMFVTRGVAAAVLFRWVAEADPPLVRAGETLRRHFDGA